MRYSQEVMSKRPLLRPRTDMDPVVPWVWGDLPLRHDPVEVVSYPIPAGQDGVIDDRATIMVRMKVGDPTSIKEVLLRHLACFDKTRHQDWYKPKLNYGDGDTNFVFVEECWLWK